MKKYPAGIIACFLISICIVSFGGVAQAADSWDTVTPPGTSGYVFNVVRSIGDYVFLGTDHGIYRSTDRGATWTQLNTGLTNLNVSSIAIGWIYNSGSNMYTVAPTSIVYAGTAGGVFATTINGSSWTATSTGITDTNITDVEIDQNQAVTGSFNNVYAATPSGVFRTTDQGSHWSLKNSGMTGQSITKLSSDFGNGVLYALTAANRLYTSTPISISGIDESWSLIHTESGTTTSDISILNAVGGTDWIATSKGVLKSNPSGLNWRTVNIGLGSTTVATVASDYIDSNLSYAAQNGDGIYRTTNEALNSPNWSQINVNLPSLAATYVTADPSNSKLVYAVVQNALYRLILSDTYVDLTPPSKITDLSVSATTSSSVTLQWSAPGNDSAFGTTTAYDVRYSTSIINDSNWSSATSIAGQPTPSVSGTTESFTDFLLTPDTQTYYFAIKSQDAASNLSPLSNLASTASVIDVTPPTVTAFSTPGSATALTIGFVTFTATDDTAVTGYLVNETASTPSLGDSNWSSTVPLTYTFGSAGTKTLYAWARDAAGNISSPLSQSVTVTISSGGGGGSGGGSGGSGGSGGGGAPATPPNPILPGLPTVPGATNASTTATTTCKTATTTNVLQPLIPTNLLSLPLYSRGSAVTSLQTLLVKYGYLAPQYVTGYYATLTKTAVAKYAAILATQAKAVTTCTPKNPAPTQTVLSRLPKGFYFTSAAIPYTTSPTIKNLQIFLNDHAFSIAASGAGSYGNETMYFGPATAKALTSFQEYYRRDVLLPSGLTHGTGHMGPATIQKMNSILRGS